MRTGVSGIVNWATFGMARPSNHHMKRTASFAFVACLLASTGAAQDPDDILGTILF